MRGLECAISASPSSKRCSQTSTHTGRRVRRSSVHAPVVLLLLLLLLLLCRGVRGGCGLMLGELLMGWGVHGTGRMVLPVGLTAPSSSVGIEHVRLHCSTTARTL